MEHMADLLIVLGAIAPPGGVDALFRQEMVHGPGVFPEKILAGGGDVGGGIGVGDVFQHPEPGIVGGEAAA